MMMNRRRIGVTSAIPDVMKGYRFVDPDLLHAAASDGTALHAVLAEYVNGTVPGDRLTVRERACVEGYEALEQDVLAMMFGSILAVEEEFVCKKYGFVGHPDQMRERGVLDHKRRRAQKKVDALQLAGYAVAGKERFGLDWYKVAHKNLIILEMVPTGPHSFNHRPVNVYDRHAEGLFLALVQEQHRQGKLQQAIKNYMQSR